jgi:hypothetical protein
LAGRETTLWPPTSIKKFAPSPNCRTRANFLFFLLFFFIFYLSPIAPPSCLTCVWWGLVEREDFSHPRKKFAPSPNFRTGANFYLFYFFFFFFYFIFSQSFLPCEGWRLVEMGGHSVFSHPHKKIHVQS